MGSMSSRCTTKSETPRRAALLRSHAASSASLSRQNDRGILLRDCSDDDYLGCWNTCHNGDLYAPAVVQSKSLTEFLINPPPMSDSLKILTLKI